MCEFFLVCVDDEQIRVCIGSVFIRVDESYRFENCSLIVLDLIDIWVPLLDLAILFLVIDPIEIALHYHNRDPIIRILDSVLELLLPGVLFNHSVSFVDRKLFIIIY